MLARSAVVLFLIGLSVAQPPESQGDDLTQFRDSPAPADSPLRASDEEFRQAVDAVREQDARATQFSTPSFPPGQPRPSAFDIRPPANWNETERGFARPAQAIQESHPPFGRVLLQKAFELERIAHELEMHGLFSEADTVRRSAGLLRESVKKRDDGEDDAEKQATLEERLKPTAEAAEPEYEVLPIVQETREVRPPAMIVQPRPQAVRQPPQYVPQRPQTVRRPPQTVQPRPQTSRRYPQTTQQQSRGSTPASPGAGQRRAAPSDQSGRGPERSLLFRRRGRL